ncbi:hypothetical protein [Pseudanabaena sp. Chao 1811]|uniref:hypothetical protein n=1 Tax=Pseudanabaena sp. Chao 1811 TaxID=2963092 RepID=UPI0022F3C7E6|nr:hypothetical protein [Pseudanabaena sp. Chao 1811]
MNKPFFLFLLISCFLAIFPIDSVFADNTKCKLTIQEIRSSLEEKKIYIKSVTFRLNSSSPYRNANQEVIFVLSGGRFENQKSLDFLNSRKLQLDIASQVVEVCDPVVRVVFGLDHSDFTNGYSYHKGMGVRKDECSEYQPRGNNYLNWGEERCL